MLTAVKGVRKQKNKYSRLHMRREHCAGLFLVLSHFTRPTQDIRLKHQPFQNLPEEAVLSFGAF